MLPKPAECQGCPLFEKGTGFSRPEGTGKNSVLIMGEALGEHESRDSLPFRPYAAAGGLLERTLRSVGLSREDFTIWNTVACRPPKDWLEGAPWEHSAISHCDVHRRRVIAQAKPRVILALGNVALRTLTEESGKNRGIGYLRGYPLPLRENINVPCFDCAGKDGIVNQDCFICGGSGITEESKQSHIHVIGSYHPSFIRRGATNLIGVLATDIRKAVTIARDGFKPHPVSYSLKPSIDEAWAFYNRVKDSPRALLTYDIETPNSRDLPEDERDDDPSYEINQIQFSLAPYEGIVFPGTIAYMEVAKAILELGNTKANQNTWNYDDPRIRAKGIKIGGIIHDTMNMWRRIQPDLPAHLQFVAGFYGMDFPWKHLSVSNSELYGCADVDAPQRIMAKLPSDMQARGVWQSYLDQTLRLHPILVGAQDIGVPINNEMRLEMKKELEAVAQEYLVSIRSRVPTEVKRIEPRKKKPDGSIEWGFAKVPPELKKWLAEGKQAPFLGTKKKESEKGKISFDPYEYVEMEIDGVRKWARKFEFNPGSTKQLLDYIKAKKHPVPKDLKTDDETTAKKELERLGKKTNDPIYNEIIEWRGTEKMLGTYVIGFTPDSNGRVHTTFTFAPGTGQLSSRNPNIQNIPKHSKLAKAFRKMIEAPPGYKIVEADYKSFHALTLGFEAQDLDYMRAARLDIHSLVSGQVLKVHEFEKIFEKSDEEIIEYCDWYKSDKDRKFHRDKEAKPSILGIGFGLGVRKLYDMNRESFANEAAAKRVCEVIQYMFPKVFQFQDMIKEKAHKQTFLLSRFNYIRWFWDVFHWDAKGRKMVAGEDAEAAIAFYPANDAFGVIKAAMIACDDLGYNKRYGLFNTVHDSTMYLCPDDLVEECIHNVYKILSAPSSVLVDSIVAPDGLACDIEVSVGQNWAEMKEFKIGKVIGTSKTADAGTPGRTILQGAV